MSFPSTPVSLPVSFCPHPPPSTLCNLSLPHTVELYRQRVLPLTSVVISSFLATRPKYSSTLSAINYHIWQSQKDILPDNLWAILTPCIGIFIVSKIETYSIPATRRHSRSVCAHSRGFPAESAGLSPCAFACRCLLLAKFHYTGPTGPDRTRTNFVGDPHGPTEFLGDPGGSGRCGSARVQSGPCSGI